MILLYRRKPIQLHNVAVSRNKSSEEAPENMGCGASKVLTEDKGQSGLCRHSAFRNLDFGVERTGDLQIKSLLIREENIPSNGSQKSAVLRDSVLTAAQLRFLSRHTRFKKGTQLISMP